MRGVELSHHHGDCSFETILRSYDLTDPVLWKIAEIIHEADLDDERYDAPEAPGLDITLRGLSMICTDHQNPHPHHTGLRRPLRVLPPGHTARPRTCIAPKIFNWTRTGSCWVS
jgi:hypothetical protein